ncbi:J domain-containing protein [Candidatus Solirubrobacter pratensis]|uniref:J domain-containing protein n=1 Tax=Candidatus Solirubrobacter pratensis TaxID=1298857 RepID=UPI0003F69D15|nr:J domain-containing protein [Candidatus Solirubrobacter pratensis]
MTGLRDRLADLEAEHATLRAELAAFESDYLRVAGIAVAELHELEARILALVAARTGAAEDVAAAGAARDRARETTTALRSVPTPAAPPPGDDLKALFREAAKRMHPDLVQDPDGRMHAEAFMKRLNDAYRAGGADAIANLVRQWETSPYARGGNDSDRMLRAAVAEAQRRLDDVRATELARLMERSLAASIEGRDLLAELNAEAEAALVAARARLAALEA